MKDLMGVEEEVEDQAKAEVEDLTEVEEVAEDQAKAEV